jgi:hypothetical protein
MRAALFACSTLIGIPARYEPSGARALAVVLNHRARPIISSRLKLRSPTVFELIWPCRERRARLWTCRWRRVTLMDRIKDQFERKDQFSRSARGRLSLPISRAMHRALATTENEPAVELRSPGADSLAGRNGAPGNQRRAAP